MGGDDTVPTVASDEDVTITTMPERPKHGESFVVHVEITRAGQPVADTATLRLTDRQHNMPLYKQFGARHPARFSVRGGFKAPFSAVVDCLGQHATVTIHASDEDDVASTPHPVQAKKKGAATRTADLSFNPPLPTVRRSARGGANGGRGFVSVAPTRRASTIDRLRR